MIRSRATTEQIYVHVTKMRVTQLKADKRNLLLIVNSHKQLSRRCLIFTPPLTLFSSLQTHRRGLVAGHHPLIFCFLSFCKPSSMRQLSFHAPFFLFPPHPSPRPDSVISQELVGKWVMQFPLLRVSKCPNTVANDNKT